MAIEGGAKAGIIAPDHSTYEYLKQRPMCPTGEQWDTVLLHWKGLHTDDDALFDKVPCYNIGRDCIPTTMLSFIRLYSWTRPILHQQWHGERATSVRHRTDARYLRWRSNCSHETLLNVCWGGTRTEDTTDAHENFFIGCCTNGHIEDLRAAAAIACSQKVAPKVRYAMILPGSDLGKKQTFYFPRRRLWLACTTILHVSCHSTVIWCSLRTRDIWYGCWFP